MSRVCSSPHISRPSVAELWLSGPIRTGCSNRKPPLRPNRTTLFLNVGELTPFWDLRAFLRENFIFYFLTKIGHKGFSEAKLGQRFSGVCSIRNCFTCTTQCNLHKTLIKETKFSRNIVIMFGDNISPLILESRKWNKLLIRKITESLPYVRITTFSGAFSKRFRHASDKRYSDILVPVISKLGGDSIDPKYLKFF